jgi:hypothetical protein
MRANLGLAAIALVALSASSAPPAQADPVPRANLTDHLTFTVLRAPAYLGGILAGANRNPLINSGTDAALRRDIVTGLERRGYVEATGNPGILVLYFVTVPPSRDFTDWDYGYPWRPDWARGRLPGSANLTPREYADGAVVVDLLDPSTGALLWQGHAGTNFPDDERRFTRDLGRTVHTILARVPVPAVAHD